MIPCRVRHVGYGWPGLCFSVGKRRLSRQDERLVQDFHIRWIEAALEHERYVFSVRALPNVSQHPICHAAGYRLLNGFRVEKPWEDGRGVERIPDCPRAPFFESWRPIAHKEARADAALNLVHLAQMIHHKLN